jgi:hypothetical protein
MMKLKGSVLGIFEVLSQHVLEGLRKTTRKLASFPTEIRSEHLQNKSLERYRYFKSLDEGFRGYSYRNRLSPTSVVTVTQKCRIHSDSCLHGAAVGYRLVRRK